MLRTEHLVLRPLSREDFDVFFDTLVADPHVMRFYHSYKTLTDREQRRAKARKDFFDHFDEGARLHGYIAWGLWVDDAFAGWCGITTAALPDPALGPEVQFMLASRFQGRGFAIHAVCDTRRAQRASVAILTRDRKNAPMMNRIEIETIESRESPVV